jgi:hypothetical protein
LQVIDDALEDAVGQCLISDRNLRVVPNGLVEYAFVREFVDFSYEGCVGSFVKGLASPSCFAYVLEVGDNASVF